MNSTSESKQLAIQLKANEDSYVTGELDLNQTLDETERLWRETHSKRDEGTITANEIMPDSQLIKIQSGLAKRSAKFYKIDSLVFNPVDFAKKVKLFYAQSGASASQRNDSDNPKQDRAFEQLWLNLGDVAQKLLYTTPCFNFIHGTFDPDPVEVIKKKRKIKEKEKMGDVTKPTSMSLNENKDNRDSMVPQVERVLGILAHLLKRSNGAVCFYEFVTDPASFGRTVENIFSVSFLVNQNCVKLIQDKNGLPCLTLVEERERKKERTLTSTNQFIMTIGYEEWQDIVRTFKLEKALIPPKTPSKK